MKRELQIGIATSMLLVVPALALAQAAGGVQNGVKIGKVFVSGENPVIRLLDKPDGTPLAVASFWRIIWSPVGAGHVCYVTTGDGKSPGDLRVALVDKSEALRLSDQRHSRDLRQILPGASVQDDPGDVQQVGGRPH